MAFDLQLLHASDLEGGVDAITSAPNFAAVIDALENQAASQAIASILISSGDNYLPGPFFSAAGDEALRDTLQSFYQDLFGEPGLIDIREGSGRIDISIMNALDFDASAVGNHEFDAGTTVFSEIIGTDIRGTGPGDVRWLGAQFPYLSANLDFSADENLSGLFTADILPSTAFQSTPTDLTAAGNAPKIANATVIERDGEKIGVIGATTQRVESISSTGGVTVKGASDNDMAVLAGQLQPIINDVLDGDDDVLGTADDVNKVILTTHLQQIALEEELASLLSGVDIIIAGGSDTLLADGNDRLRSGDTAARNYPIIATGQDSNPVAIVSTDGQYSYVGRLVITFDDDGVIVPSSIKAAVSGAYATEGNITTPGFRVRSLGITGEDGRISDLIVQDGEIVGDPNREIRLVTLNFLADGGDSYPFDIFGDNRVDGVA